MIAACHSDASFFLRERGDLLAGVQQRQSRVSVPHDCKPVVATLKVGPNLRDYHSPGTQLRLEIRKPHIVGPVVSVESNVVTAMAIDEHAAHTHLPHFAERDLERPAGGVRSCVASDGVRPAAIETRRGRESNRQSVASRNARELLGVVGV
ncbi:hypothetical protein [Bradyrhizobium sp. AZCC 2230]|uniref:hypothetical protein n=1 Tax=Bradyrhizobium sp. AZCC 2230 TaxID=3117021 RepID=UPI002FEED76B